MTYQAKFALIKAGTYGGKIYEDQQEYGNPPPNPPKRYILLENGQFLLLESGHKIELETGTP